MVASTPSTRGRSRIRESRTYGSVRGAPGNRRSYREQLITKKSGPVYFRLMFAPGQGRESRYILASSVDADAGIGPSDLLDSSSQTRYTSINTLGVTGCERPKDS